MLRERVNTDIRLGALGQAPQFPTQITLRNAIVFVPIANIMRHPSLRQEVFERPVMSDTRITSFSVSTPAFPWDLLDEGPAAFLDGAIEHIGANAVFSPICYYWEESAVSWWDGVMPHNKRIRRYFPEYGWFFAPARLVCDVSWNSTSDALQ